MRTYKQVRGGIVRFAPDEVEAISRHYGEGIRVTLKSGRVYLLEMIYLPKLERIIGYRI